MVMKQAVCVVVLLGALAACSSDSEPDVEPDPTETSSATTEASPVDPAYVESDECRDGASKVLDVIDLALNDSDVRDAASRLDTLNKTSGQDLSLCTSAVVRPTSEAIDSLTDALDAALDGGNVGKHMIAATDRVAEARSALDATE